MRVLVLVLLWGWKEDEVVNPTDSLVDLEEVDDELRVDASSRAPSRMSNRDCLSSKSSLPSSAML